MFTYKRKKMSLYNNLSTDFVIDAVYQKNEGPVRHYNIIVDNDIVGNVAIFREVRKEDGQTLEYIVSLSVDTDIAEYGQVKGFIENYVMEND